MKIEMEIGELLFAPNYGLWEIMSVIVVSNRKECRLLYINTCIYIRLWIQKWIQE
jgi:hypothetical protein